MKDIPLDTVEADALRLVPFLGLGEGGTPKLALDADTEVVALVPPPKDLAQGFAVTRAFGGGRLAILGYLTKTALAEAVGLQQRGDWLELRHGKAALRLNQDGRVRIKGADIRLDADGVLGLDAAEIALN